MSVSVLIVSRDRYAFLRHVVGKLCPSFRPGDELVLVDDGSETPIGELLDALPPFSGRRLIRHDASAGYIACRNEGLLACSKAVVLQLDDDSWPVGANALARAEQAMSEFPEVGAFALPIHYHRRSAVDECGSLSLRWRGRHLARETAFMGCGAILRRDAVIRAGLYPSYCGYGGEEASLCARLYRVGYDTRVFTGIRVIHGHEVLSTTKEYLETRADIHSAALAANRLCFIAETFAWPLRPLLFVAAVLRARAVGIRGSLLHADYEAKRSFLSPRLRLSVVRSFSWAVRMGKVALRLSTGFGCESWRPRAIGVRESL